MREQLRCAVQAMCLLLLAGCAGERIDPQSIGWVPPGDENVVFRRGLDEARPLHVRYRDVWQQEDYALFEQNGARAELIYAAADPATPVALDFDLSLARAVGTFSFNAGSRVIWGELGRVPGRSEAFFYRPYVLAERSRLCFGFVALGQVRREDPHRRPARVLFGYYCAPEGRRLDRGTMVSLIEAITVRRRDRLGEEPRLRADAAALRVARGRDARDAAGNPGFPFGFARQFTIEEDGEREN